MFPKAWLNNWSSFYYEIINIVELVEFINLRFTQKINTTSLKIHFVFKFQILTFKFITLNELFYQNRTKLYCNIITIRIEKNVIQILTSILILWLKKIIFICIDFKLQSIVFRTFEFNYFSSPLCNIGVLSSVKFVE